MVIVEDGSRAYGAIKSLGDNVFNVPTQVLLEKNVKKCDRNILR